MRLPPQLKGRDHEIGLKGITNYRLLTKTHLKYKTQKEIMLSLGNQEVKVNRLLQADSALQSTTHCQVGCFPAVKRSLKERVYDLEHMSTNKTTSQEMSKTNRAVGEINTSLVRVTDTTSQIREQTLENIINSLTFIKFTPTHL